LTCRKTPINQSINQLSVLNGSWRVICHWCTNLALVVYISMYQFMAHEVCSVHHSPGVALFVNCPTYYCCSNLKETFLIAFNPFCLSLERKTSKAQLFWTAEAMSQWRQWSALYRLSVTCTPLSRSAILLSILFHQTPEPVKKTVQIIHKGASCRIRKSVRGEDIVWKKICFQVVALLYMNCSAIHILNAWASNPPGRLAQIDLSCVDVTCRKTPINQSINHFHWRTAHTVTCSQGVSVIVDKSFCLWSTAWFGCLFLYRSIIWVLVFGIKVFVNRRHGVELIVAQL